MRSYNIFLIVECEKLKMHILNTRTAMEKINKIVNPLARLIKKSREKDWHNLSMSGKKTGTLVQIIQTVERLIKGHYE